MICRTLSTWWDSANTILRVSARGNVAYRVTRKCIAKPTSVFYCTRMYRISNALIQLAEQTQRTTFTWTTSSRTISALSFSCRPAPCDVACTTWRRPTDVRTPTCSRFCSLSRYPPALEIMTSINTFWVDGVAAVIKSRRHAVRTTYRLWWRI